MKKINLLLFFISINIFGQSINESQLIGKWNVVDLEGMFEIPDAEKETMEALKKAFIESTFEFESDHHFTLDIDFIGIEDMMIKVHWNYIKEKSKIVIQEWKDKEKLSGGLMEIQVENKEGKFFFSLVESSIILEVQK